MSRAVASKDVDAREVADASEIQRLLAEDQTPWYQKPNLRRLYFFLVPAALGVEMTSGEYYSLSCSTMLTASRIRWKRVERTAGECALAE
jgi:hypothetical protein